MNIEEMKYKEKEAIDAAGSDGFEFSLAEQFALQTDQHIFLTGKAGSGKTTLLKNIAARTSKNYIVVAPTGVAAINSGGVTIHSMFHFPFTALIPSDNAIDANMATNRRLLISHLRFNREKKKVLQELELLIIDEVSMVRADILDGIDFALQFVRRNRSPFGGIQVMLIGDMHQLPPVVRDHEWEILKNYYTSPYFFDALVWKNLNAVQIELKKVFRQQDEKFLGILNNIRDKEMQQEDYEQLEKRYQPDFRPDGEGYILLSTHNRKADSVNDYELKKLPGKTHSFAAIIAGEFPESMYPCDAELKLKKGAQVMFIRNDSEQGKYFNGKLAVVKDISSEEITVTFNDSGEDFKVPRETWENINYQIDQSGKIQKNELGSFVQYPLRLAWAITIHKSQGLTFEKVIIDAGQSFAAGQVYVALSRCRTLEGIVLHSRITQSALFNDDKINSFSQTHHKASELQQTLASAKARYSNQLLTRLFTFEKLLYRMMEWKDMITEKEIPNKKSAVDLCEKITGNTELLIDTAAKFRKQVERLLREYAENNSTFPTLKDRCSKAIDYFTTEIFVTLINPLNVHVQSYAYKTKMKKYLALMLEIEDDCWATINRLYHASFLDEKLHSGEAKIIRGIQKVKTSATEKKKQKGGTYKDTLALHHQKKSIEEIASIRSLALSTVKSHFAKLIKSGDVDISSLLPADTISDITKAIGKEPGSTISEIKFRLADKYDFDEIRWVFTHIHKND
jgi:ATP-dependent DNA helicase PIF1